MNILLWTIYKIGQETPMEENLADDDVQNCICYDMKLNSLLFLFHKLHGCKLFFYLSPDSTEYPRGRCILY